MNDIQQQLADDTVNLATEPLEGLAPDGTGPQPPVAPRFDQAYELRRRRILDHRAEAQADTNTLMACLAGVNSDLLDCELHVGETFRQDMAASSMSIEDVERQSGLIELLLRLAKQIAQLSQLEISVRKKGEREIVGNNEANKLQVCAPRGDGYPAPSPPPATML